MAEPATHSVARLEGEASRRHRDRTVDDLREEARRALGDTDLSGVRTLVQFAGFPRSGHSVVGALLDAHPDAAASHELDLMGLISPAGADGLTREELLTLVCASSADFERHGRWWNGYRYHVPGGSGGAAARPLVLGDKKGDWAVRRVLDRPGLLAELEQRVAPVRPVWVAVLRNPYDNVATMSLRKGKAYDRIRIRSTGPEDFAARLGRAQADGRVPDEALPEMVEDYARLCEGVAVVRDAVPAGSWLELRHEDLVSDPRRELTRLLAFLDLPATTSYLDAAAGAVAAAAGRSRDRVRWSPETSEQLAGVVERHAFLAGGADDER